jgi:hypothetical protein
MLLKTATASAAPARLVYLQLTSNAASLVAEPGGTTLPDSHRRLCDAANVHLHGIFHIHTLLQASLFLCLHHFCTCFLPHLQPCSPACPAPHTCVSCNRPPFPASRPAPRPAAELSNSFIITSLQDLEQQNIHGTLQTPCEYAIRRARAIGGKQFSIVVTAYWQVRR